MSSLSRSPRQQRDVCCLGKRNVCAGSDGFAFDSFPFAPALPCLSNAQMCHAQLEDRASCWITTSLALLQSTTAHSYIPCSCLPDPLPSKPTDMYIAPCRALSTHSHTRMHLIGKFLHFMELSAFACAGLLTALRCRGNNKARCRIIAIISIFRPKGRERRPPKGIARKGKWIRCRVNANKGWQSWQLAIDDGRTHNNNQKGCLRVSVFQKSTSIAAPVASFALSAEKKSRGSFKTRKLVNELITTWTADDWDSSMRKSLKWHWAHARSCVCDNRKKKPAADW